MKTAGENPAVVALTNGQQDDLHLHRPLLIFSTFFIFSSWKITGYALNEKDKERW